MHGIGTKSQGCGIYPVRSDVPAHQGQKDPNKKRLWEKQVQQMETGVVRMLETKLAVMSSQLESEVAERTATQNDLANRTMENQLLRTELERRTGQSEEFEREVEHLIRKSGEENARLRRMISDSKSETERLREQMEQERIRVEAAEKVQHRQLAEKEADIFEMSKEIERLQREYQTLLLNRQMEKERERETQMQMQMLLQQKPDPAPDPPCHTNNAHAGRAANHEPMQKNTATSQQQPEAEKEKEKQGENVTVVTDPTDVLRRRLALAESARERLSCLLEKRTKELEGAKKREEKLEAEVRKEARRAKLLGEQLGFKSHRLAIAELRLRECGGAGAAGHPGASDLSLSLSAAATIAAVTSSTGATGRVVEREGEKGGKGEEKEKGAPKHTASLKEAPPACMSVKNPRKSTRRLHLKECEQKERRAGEESLMDPGRAGQKSAESVPSLSAVSSDSESKPGKDLEETKGATAPLCYPPGTTPVCVASQDFPWTSHSASDKPVGVVNPSQEEGTKSNCCRVGGEENDLGGAGDGQESSRKSKEKVISRVPSLSLGHLTLTTAEGDEEKRATTKTKGLGGVVGGKKKGREKNPRQNQTNLPRLQSSLQPISATVLWAPPASLSLSPSPSSHQTSSTTLQQQQQQQRKGLDEAGVPPTQQQLCEVNKNAPGQAVALPSVPPRVCSHPVAASPSPSGKLCTQTETKQVPTAHPMVSFSSSITTASTPSPTSETETLQQQQGGMRGGMRPPKQPPEGSQGSKRGGTVGMRAVSMGHRRGGMHRCPMQNHLHQLPPLPELPSLRPGPAGFSSVAADTNPAKKERKEKTNEAFGVEYEGQVEEKLQQSQPKDVQKQKQVDKGEELLRPSASSPLAAVIKEEAPPKPSVLHRQVGQKKRKESPGKSVHFQKSAEGEGRSESSSEASMGSPPASPPQPPLPFEETVLSPMEGISNGGAERQNSPAPPLPHENGENKTVSPLSASPLGVQGNDAESEAEIELQRVEVEPETDTDDDFDDFAFAFIGGRAAYVSDDAAGGGAVGSSLGNYDESDEEG